MILIIVWRTSIIGFLRRGYFCRGRGWGFVLLERFTGKKYDYRMVDLTTLKIKKLFSRTTPLSESGYRRAMEKMQGRGNRRWMAGRAVHTIS